MSKPKKGKIIRVSEDTKSLLEDHRMVGETWGQLVARLISTSPGNQDIMWVLPSRLMTKAGARQTSIKEAAAEDIPFEEREMPIKVAEII